MKKSILVLASFLCSFAAFAQKRSVSITIDDVPNVRLFQEDGYSSKLLSKLDSLKIPVAIFVNEHNLRQTKPFDKNKNLLKTWLSKDFVTPGNHSYSHPNYGEIGFEAFSGDVLKGETLTKEILKGSGKKLDYFRFPFNAMGKDSVAHLKMQEFLVSKNYKNTPFTVESEDWLFTQLYEKALKSGDKKRAMEIGNQYVKLSLDRFAHFDSVSVVNFQRPVKQIYLCHDNRLNTDFLPVLVQKLKEQGYQMISLADAMQDPAYQSREYYHGNAGFSWLYRWMSDLNERKGLMLAEPENVEIHKAYEEMQKAK
ncbi:polysaccharide deacetylase family protein [Dyadobacter sp. CY323]|uniref:polysaccharide deacetylase family protein n=1 Tax=Dyadobacter sp. CY323 TaxID=2907302 RepID=UPI001F3F46F5|nr:polysaccharide deacetylase family protein [Dyadobacter sp. CY323]MCE6990876.1 polysaccharide deacetylase family protein [Dyadobacter sp. CY323]